MTIFTITYNEELMLPHFIKHYRNRFPDCGIIIYDNQSTDNTIKIAEEHGCYVMPYITGGKLSDTGYLNIKNNCWKGVEGWVIVVDCDELLDINEAQIKDLSTHGCTMVKATGYNMVNINDDLDIEAMRYGVRAPSYDKTCCFNASRIKEMNYGPGAHSCSPVGLQRYVTHDFIMWHYKYINMDYMIKRHAHFANRLSDENIQRGYGAHYQYPPQQIQEEFFKARIESVLIKPKSI